MRRTISMLACAAVVLAAAPQQLAHASLFGYPRTLYSQTPRIAMSSPALAPMAFVQFCMQYAGECKTRRTIFRGGGVKLTKERQQELRKVNIEVNRAIRPQRNLAGLAGERWLISPASGDCNDYAVTKRHELLARGWPAHALLLAEVVTSWNEHHIVLVVRTSDGDMVADSLNANIKPWQKTNYRWLRIQSTKNPFLWSAVGEGAV